VALDELGDSGKKEYESQVSKIIGLFIFLVK